MSLVLIEKCCSVVAFMVAELDLLTQRQLTTTTVRKIGLRDHWALGWGGLSIYQNNGKLKYMTDVANYRE